MPQTDEQRLFGTDGIRGVAGEFPLDDFTVVRFGRSLVSNLAAELGREPRILVGRDTRESGPLIESALMRGARAAGADIQSAGVITTPGVAYITRVTPFDAGVVISASHNPFRDNGIKVFSPSGKKLGDEMERRIEADLRDSTSGTETNVDQTKLGSDEPRQIAKEDRHRERYIDYLTQEVGRGLSLGGMKIAIDCANGAAFRIAPDVFRRLGAQLQVFSDEPNGRNINEGCGSLHLERLQAEVVSRKLDLGIAFDGDADRALFVDATGRIADGDVALLILADLLRAHGRLTGDVVVATVMSNIGLELALRERGIELARAQVGDRYVLEELLARGARLGGEQSGHIIFPEISLAGDGLITAIELLRAVCESGRTLGQLGRQMTRYPQLLVNVRVRTKPDLESIADVKAEMDRLTTELRGGGRLLVRYSGTENLARVMIEGKDETKIKEQAHRLASIIDQAIGE
ncbi:MAG TPA: phosphoglucosamine mutase [Blastocatellia bacterium]|nr:phosphoglucosamine mutase [Blastocatellia bacterium]